MRDRKDLVMRNQRSFSVKQMYLKYRDLVEVKAPKARFGLRGHIVNRFSRDCPLYAVQLPDNAITYFEESELEKIPPEKAATDWERGIGFKDVVEKETSREGRNGIGVSIHHRFCNVSQP